MYIDQFADYLRLERNYSPRTVASYRRDLVLFRQFLADTDAELDLLDGLQQLGPEVTKIDTKHIGVTGCSYAGKMALFCGAFDERVALTIAQEPGGGGAAAWPSMLSTLGLS